MNTEAKREYDRARSAEKYVETKATKYHLRGIQEAIEEAVTVKGWAEFGCFKEIYREMTDEQREHLCMLIGDTCVKCNGMGPLSAAELIWAAAAHTRRYRNIVVFEGGRR